MDGMGEISEEHALQRALPSIAAAGGNSDRHHNERDRVSVSRYYFA